MRQQSIWRLYSQLNELGILDVCPRIFEPQSKNSILLVYDERDKFARYIHILRSSQLCYRVMTDEDFKRFPTVSEVLDFILLKVVGHYESRVQVWKRLRSKEMVEYYDFGLSQIKRSKAYEIYLRLKSGVFP